MLKNLWQALGFSAIALGLIATAPTGAAVGALFDQEDVAQEKFVAIAVPLPQSDRYNLIVLEQKSDTQLCWEETNDEGVINPLLLNFDFSGICGRSTDSNGYSIRQVGEDLALKYRLSLQKKDGVLVLVGVPLQAAYGKPFEIGRTQTLSDKFLKITLNPDWRLTRRVYQGQSLGHLYFTRDVIPPEPEEDLIEVSNALAELEEEVKESDEDSLAVEEAVVDASPALEDAQSDDVRSIHEETSPQSFSSGGPQPLQGPVQIPVPTPQSLQSPQPLDTQQPVSDVLPPPMTPIPVPTIAPLGRVGASEPDVFSNHDLDRLQQVDAAGDPPPPPFNIAFSLKRYRIYVSAADAERSDVINPLAPDAFWTHYQGQRVLQVGAFLEKEKVDWMIDQLGQQGISGMIDASQY